MTEWEARNVRALVDDLDRAGRVSSAVAERARLAIDDGRYQDALDIALGERR
ncbi:hypothetical protein GRS48_00300 [Halorubrum sp. JWXQ-INN 858]|uniref:hypothetical protein n=1 Tax=Halorubrum sp. JWXQ-INN 858 TaxID=2690782 RepID=UPI00135CC339|nr:hypothetical protein [Halorubrum sp. JWXQ-INN 858]MWV63276.1 hypothetical protein [Halorubrum sp. JWXQ-INN 858]